ncbi:putative pentatricopeptide repeat-containing protein At1g56570 [Selaginella moellendorffii]|uniref:putative pentatricopeptide repeat-containing protein At1g56570 n=1 Tax=Selaginella moellendorffii TaxID=88036 RepID=UPI000D1C73D7|nr:putative pentatricopeptide repeat-containing protein At1g56570 [Selaginella moellendorffii]|eukprot:XP_024515313.1 putative pentatricopeptide repeat-containing protein At1g56570 [Selaginella moellendorffii]
MAGVGRTGNSSKNREIVVRFQDAGSKPSVALILAALKACSKSRNEKLGREIHAAARESGFMANSFVVSSLIDMYAKCGRMADASTVFHGMEIHSIVSWNSLILGYAENHQPERALQLYDRMLREESLAPNHVTDLAALKACVVLAREEDPQIIHGQPVRMKTLEIVMRIHSRAARAGSSGQEELHIFLANFLVDVYSRCGSAGDSRRVFDRIQHRSVVSWTSMILGYADNHRGELGLELFEEMCRAGCSQNQVTFIAALKACSSMAERDPGALVHGKLVKLQALETGMSLHSRAEAAGLSEDSVVANTLIDIVFDATPRKCVISWTGTIMGYALNGDGEVALEFFRQMDDHQCQPNYVTVLAAIKACVSLAENEAGTMILGRMVKTSSLEIGRTLHRQARENGHEKEIFVVNALIDMYSKCGSLEDAFTMFWSIHRRDSVSWSSIIQACADNGEDEQALHLFSTIQREKKVVSPAIFVAALKSCGNLGALERGRALELEITNAGLARNLMVANSLVGVYGRCGSTADAQRVFDSLPPHCRDLVTWNALVDAYGRHGDTAQVMSMFHAMQHSHDRTLWPNSVTFLLALSACCHAGLVDEGKTLLAAMIQENRVIPSIKHYTCVIDLLGRANRLDEAVELVERLPFEADAVIWTSLMDAAHKFGDDRVGRKAFDAVAKLEARSAAYVMMSNIVGAAAQEP